MKKINRLLDNKVVPRACQALASFTRSSRGDAAKRSGQNRHEHPLDLALRAIPELSAERGEDQPIQQAGDTTNPEDELRNRSERQIERVLVPVLAGALRGTPSA